MNAPVLRVHNLAVQFASAQRLVKAVDAISFDIPRGQTLGIVGESGSGKSMTSLAIMGLVPSPGRITQGEIWFQHPGSAPSSGDRGEAVNLAQLSQRRLEDYRGGEISMIFQEPMSSLNPVYTIGFQITEAIRLHKRLGQAEAEQAAIALLQEVRVLPSDADLRQRYSDDHQRRGQPLPSEADADRYSQRYKQAMLKRYPHELSGGQMQRVMIAMAISCDPVLLIADEPTTALDVTVQATILDLLRDLRDRRGMSILFITHDLGIIAEIADQVAVMYQGKIVESGPVIDIFSNPQHPYTKGLLTCRPRLDQRLRILPTVADFMEVCTDATTGDVMIAERPVDQPANDRMQDTISDAELSDRLVALQKQNPLLAVRDLQVAFPIKGALGMAKGYTMAVNGVSFSVYPGETLGLVGESGCGKSTLARAILRLIEPTGGDVVFDGDAVLTLPPDRLRLLRREMQIIFQNPFSALDPRLSVGSAIMEPMQIHRQPASAAAQRDEAAYLLERVGLTSEALGRYPHEFSGGQRQRICIARALALRPKFIICDESVSALDVSVQAQVLNLLKELQTDFNLTYIFISHDLSVVKFMSDRILVMNRGRIEELGPSEQIYRYPQKDYTRDLIAAIPLGTLASIQHRQAQRQ
jgi:peptide/nickel transport system ATP-binding protein